MGAIDRGVPRFEIAQGAPPGRDRAEPRRVGAPEGALMNPVIAVQTAPRKKVKWVLLKYFTVILCRLDYIRLDPNP